jgi:hypothetical protein
MTTSPDSETKLTLNAVVPFSECSPPEPLSPKSLTDQAQEFVRLVNSGIEAWATAGKMLVQLRFIDPQIFRKIMAVAPWISTDVLVNFCRIGEGRMYPQILLLPHCPAWADAINATVTVQETICNGPIEVVTAMKQDRPVTQKLWVRELDRKSAALVFKNGMIRSVEQQVAVLKTQKIVPAKTWSPPPIKAAVETQPMNPVISATSLVSVGCYLIWFQGDELVLSKYDGSPLANTQPIILKANESNMLGAMIEFKKWKMK